ncbi:MAG: cytochrome c oxidase subunit II [Actinomycetota bacterium]|nr:cytochrome c oxidase subunit II [Actinomycetota bacterium]
MTNGLARWARSTGRRQPAGEERPAVRGWVRRARVAAVLLGGALVLGGCNAPTFGAFRGATTQGRDEFRLWVGFAITGLAVAAIVWGLIFWTVIRHRRRGSDAIPRQFHENVPLEIVYTTLPFVIVLVLFYFTVVTENRIDAVSASPSEVVHVLGFRWGWSFTYDSGTGRYQGVQIATAAQPKVLAQPATSSQYPQLVLPLGETTRIVLTSADVIHGFYVPAFNFSRYAQPGVVNRFDFTPTTTGVFRGQCSQFCGLYHSEMLFSVRVVSRADFARWLATEQASQAQTGSGATS